MDPRKQAFLELFAASGWTQAEAARQLGMTRGGIHGILKGAANPSAATVKLFGLLLKVEETPAARPPVSERLKAVYKKIRSLPEGDQEMVIRVVESVLNLTRKCE